MNAKSTEDRINMELNPKEKLRGFKGTFERIVNDGGKTVRVWTPPTADTFATGATWMCRPQGGSFVAELEILGPDTYSEIRADGTRGSAPATGGDGDGAGAGGAGGDAASGMRASPYKGRWIHVKLECSAAYPSQDACPKVYFCDEVYHPGIEPGSGKVCLDGLKADWMGWAASDGNPSLLRVARWLRENFLGRPEDDYTGNGDAAALLKTEKLPDGTVKYPTLDTFDGKAADSVRALPSDGAADGDDADLLGAGGDGFGDDGFGDDGFGGDDAFA